MDGLDSSNRFVIVVQRKKKFHAESRTRTLAVKEKYATHCTTEPTLNSQKCETSVAIAVVVTLTICGPYVLFLMLRASTMEHTLPITVI